MSGSFQHQNIWRKISIKNYTVKLFCILYNYILNIYSTIKKQRTKKPIHESVYRALINRDSARIKILSPLTRASWKKYSKLNRDRFDLSFRCDLAVKQWDRALPSFDQTREGGGNLNIRMPRVLEWFNLEGRDRSVSKEAIGCKSIGVQQLRQKGSNY